MTQEDAIFYKYMISTGTNKLYWVNFNGNNFFTVGLCPWNMVLLETEKLQNFSHYILIWIMNCIYMRLQEQKIQMVHGLGGVAGDEQDWKEWNIFHSINLEYFKYFPWFYCVPLRFLSFSKYKRRSKWHYFSFHYFQDSTPFHTINCTVK